MKRILFLSIHLLLINAIYSQEGTLDTSFSDDGKVTYDYNNLTNTSTDIAIQSDGKIVAVGYTEGNTFDSHILRYNTDGTLDQSFGNNGAVIYDFGSTDALFAVEILNNGKIIVGGSTYNTSIGSTDFLLACFNPDGTLDTTFGNQGKVISNLYNLANVIFSFDRIKDILIQPDGKILVAGVARRNSGTSIYALARYNPDGSFDTSFGENGITNSSENWSNASSAGERDINSIALLPDGKIISAGFTTLDASLPTKNLTITRFNSDGSLDTSFSNNGETWIPFTEDGIFHGITTTSDNKILAIGNTGVNSVIYRFNQDGSIDQSFDNDGRVLPDVHDDDSIFSSTGLNLLIQNDGKILALVDIHRPGESIGVFRYLEDGSVDNSFGVNGLATFDFTSVNDNATKMAFQNDGKIVVLGYTVGNSGNLSDFALARLNNTNALSLEENNTLATLKYFPNPTKDYISIENPANTITKIELINVNGQIINTFDVTANRMNSTTIRLNLSSYAMTSGFLKIHTLKGTKTIQILKH